MILTVDKDTGTDKVAPEMGVHGDSLSTTHHGGSLHTQRDRNQQGGQRENEIHVLKNSLPEPGEEQQKKQFSLDGRFSESLIFKIMIAKTCVTFEIILSILIAPCFLIPCQALGYENQTANVFYIPLF